MKKYYVDVNGEARIIPASSARVAINKMLRSIIGTRTADKMMPLFITVRSAKRGEGSNSK